MATMILIIIGGTIVLAGIVVILVSMIDRNRKEKQNVGTKRGVVVFKGVDTKSLSLGQGNGALFKPGMDDYGTVVHGGGVRRMWHVRVQFLNSGKTQDLVFSNRMAIGRRRSDMKIAACVEIAEDRMVSGVHCYLIGLNGVLYIRDADSLNRTYINDKCVTDNMEVPNGSVIRVGHTKLRVNYEYR